tara:strand:+ start:280 stop:816 length:537 start_codon:yes stop_codon:yes gene_type:complete
MKRILLAVLVLFGIQTQAQITLCDSNMTYTTGSQYQLEIAFPITGNSLPFMAPIYAITYGGQTTLGEDSCFSQPCNHIVYNYNPTTGMPYDTITTCLSYTLTDSLGYVDTMSCCFNQVWDGQAWLRMANMGTPTAILELEVTRLNDNIMYDMLGRELIKAPIGVMYIQNRKLKLKLNK